MQSQVLYSSYHHDRLLPVEYKTHCMRNDSLSSDSSCNQNSIKYSQSSVSDVTSDDDSSTGENNLLKGAEINGVMYRKENSDEELAECIKATEEIETHHTAAIYNIYSNWSNSLDDYGLVEGRDYDVIIEYTTNPNSSAKSPVPSKFSKHVSPTEIDKQNKKNDSEMLKSACTANDNCNQYSSKTLKMIIRNKSEVILNCDSQKENKQELSIAKVTAPKAKKRSFEDNLEKCTASIQKDEQERNKNKLSRKVNSDIIKINIKEQEDKTMKEPARNKRTVVNCPVVVAGPRNEKKLQIPEHLKLKTRKRSFENELNHCMELTSKKTELAKKRKKINLQEDKSRRDISSNSCSAQIRSKAIVRDMQSNTSDKVVECPIARTAPNGLLHTASYTVREKQIFDPIKEASRKFLMNFKKQKAEASIKRDENIIKSKTCKVENFQIQPLMTDSDYLKIVGMTKAEPKTEKNLFDDKLNKCMASIQKDEQKINKNKLNRNFNRDNIVVVTSRASEEGPRTENKLQALESLVSKTKKKSFDNKLNHCTESASKHTELPTKKKQINLEEYRYRRGISSNISSA
ncbi:unnamed protein product [Arctia plantaginis]|uniref:Uncharacterized protein n=1 Tax=Arctia plantaginis TaxID=874455 RepID=A0A8S1B9P0_ARCPL|nr:unnamed protein product [Arctia plantaginis]